MVGMVAQSGPDERSGPLTSSERFAQVVLVCSLGAGYIVVSSGLISYNKFLIHRERFPFAVPLVFMHACFCSCLSFFLYLVKPSLFPSLTDEAQRVPLDRDLILKGALPIAIFFSGQLALSNSAYLHSSVAFLQMMKEANLALVYTLSLAAALERFYWRHAAILVAVVAATLMTIHGEFNFSFTGFALQGSSQLLECTKIVLQALLLSAPGRKLDALTYVLLVMPCCALLLGTAIFGIHFFTQSSALLLPTTADLVVWWPHLLANSCIAFAVNVVVALFVKHSSAVSFILAGMVKGCHDCVRRRARLHREHLAHAGRRLRHPARAHRGLHFGEVFPQGVRERHRRGPLPRLARRRFGSAAVGKRLAVLGRGRWQGLRCARGGRCSPRQCRGL
mmetsp:Transcript_37745/g.108278  ORF Transcript_37745/g.108278 Transcript_37745/m.108278 type:complete len:392 (-) Transcript_37745:107-1282(-)